MKGISLYFIYPVSMFLLGFFSHMAYVEFFYPNKLQNKVQEPMVYTQEEVAQVVETPGEITTCDTSYIIVEYNLKENSQNSTAGKLPEKYLGMTRDKLEAAFQKGLNNPEFKRIYLEDMGIEPCAWTAEETAKWVESNKAYYASLLEKYDKK